MKVFNPFLIDRIGIRADNGSFLVVRKDDVPELIEKLRGVSSMRITFAKNVNGLLQDELTEIDVTQTEYRHITDHPLIRMNGTLYQRDSRDRSVYFDISVLELNAETYMK